MQNSINTKQLLAISIIVDLIFFGALLYYFMVYKPSVRDELSPMTQQTLVLTAAYS